MIQAVSWCRFLGEFSGGGGLVSKFYRTPCASLQESTESVECLSSGRIETYKVDTRLILAFAGAPLRFLQNSFAIDIGGNFEGPEGDKRIWNLVVSVHDRFEGNNTDFGILSVTAAARTSMLGLANHLVGSLGPGLSIANASNSKIGNKSVSNLKILPFTPPPEAGAATITLVQYNPC